MEAHSIQMYLVLYFQLALSVYIHFFHRAVRRHKLVTTNISSPHRKELRQCCVYVDILVLEKNNTERAVRLYF